MKPPRWQILYHGFRNNSILTNGCGLLRRIQGDVKA